MKYCKKLSVDEHFEVSEKLYNMTDSIRFIKNTISHKYPINHKLQKRCVSLLKYISQLRSDFDGEYNNMLTDAEIDKYGQIYYSKFINK